MEAPVAFCFVSPEDWPEFCRISEDISDDAPYENWSKKITEMEIAFKEKGVALVRVYTKPADLLAWCQAKGLKVDSPARSQYAATKVMETKADQH